MVGTWSPDRGVVSIADTEVTSPYLPRYLQHEHEHTWDADLRPGAEPNVPSPVRMVELARDAAHPEAAEIARRIMTGQAELARGAPALRGPNSHGPDDPGHYTTGLYEGVRFDPTLLPPDLSERYFSFADTLRPSETARREREYEQLVAAAQDYWSQVPWWMATEFGDPAPIAATAEGPPPIYGPSDHAVTELGGYVDRDTGAYVPFPWER